MGSISASQSSTEASILHAQRSHTKILELDSENLKIANTKYKTEEEHQKAAKSVQAHLEREKREFKKAIDLLRMQYIEFLLYGPLEKGVPYGKLDEEKFRVNYKKTLSTEISNIKNEMNLYLGKLGTGKKKDERDQATEWVNKLTQELEKVSAENKRDNEYFASLQKQFQDELARLRKLHPELTLSSEEIAEAKDPLLVYGKIAALQEIVADLIEKVDKLQQRLSVAGGHN